MGLVRMYRAVLEARLGVEGGVCLEQYCDEECAFPAYLGAGEPVVLRDGR